MELKAREKGLMIATLIAIVVYGVWEFGGIGESFDEATDSGSDVESLQAEFESKLNLIAAAPGVYREFNELVGSEEARPLDEDGKPVRADLAFQGEIATMCQLLNFNNPDLKLDVEDIEGVGDYQLALVTIQIREGTYPRIAELLKGLERRGLVIREADLKATIDSDNMSAKLTVGKIIEYTWETPARRRAARAAKRT